LGEFSSRLGRRGRRQQLVEPAVDLDPVDVAVDAGIGPDLDRSPLRPDPDERQRRGDVDIGRKAARRRPRRAGKDALRRRDPPNLDAVLFEVGGAGQSRARLAGHHADARDLALGRRRHRIEAEERPRRHEDMTAAAAGEIDEVEIVEKGAAAHRHKGAAQGERRHAWTVFVAHRPRLGMAFGPKALRRTDRCAEAHAKSPCRRAGRGSRHSSRHPFPQNSPIWDSTAARYST
jgi:hypothetical protein